MIEERQIGELPDRSDHRIRFAREFGAGLDRRTAAATLVGRHPAFGLCQFDAAHFAILCKDAGHCRALEKMNAFCFDRVHLQFIGRNLAAGPIEHQVNFSRTQASRDSGGIESRDASTDNGHPAADRDRFAEIDLAQEGRRRNHTCGVFTLKPDR